MNTDNKYHQAKIYTIRCTEDTNLIYVGSTIQPLYKRWHEHKRKHNNKNNLQYNTPYYTKMRELGIDKFYIELYEDIKCENIEQLHRREGEVIRKIGTLNKNIAGRTDKEYWEDNKEQRKKKYQDNKECMLSKIRQYYAKNKEIIKQMKKENYEKNKEQISEKKAITINCICGSCFRKCDVARHNKTKKHTEFIKNQTQ